MLDEKTIDGEKQAVRVDDAIQDVFAEIEAREQRGVETGFFELDDMLNGLQPGELIVIGGRPGMGKTAIALNIVEHVSADNRLPTAVFSLEMSKKQLTQRMLCTRGEIDSHKMRKGLLLSQEYVHLANVVGEFAQAPIWIDDSFGLTASQFRSRARELREAHGIRLFVLDYIQLLERRRRDNLHQELAGISRVLKQTARELNVPIVALSQLNRWQMENFYRRPRLSDLRDSGSLEDDADVVLLIHREDYYRMAEPDFQPDNIAEVIIAKQRNGPIGTVKLTFLNKSTRFANLSAANDPFA